MYKYFFLIILTCLFLSKVNGVQDNSNQGILGDPYLICGKDLITVRFDTRNSFKGVIFVQNQIQNPECRSAPIDSKNLASRNAEITLDFQHCNLEKRRSTRPNGLFISTTIILAFNPDFLSKIDRIYMVRCFYMEMITSIEKQIQVTMPPPPLQTQQVPMPVCRYEVLESTPAGPPVYYATVGQQVYHKWTCDTETENQFCMIVHSCTVDDGNGDKVLLIDEKGCAQDKYLLQNLDYISDLMVGKEAHVYKYADRPSMYFDCQISITIKEPNQEYCDVPSCPDPPRRRRNDFNGSLPLENLLGDKAEKIQQNNEINEVDSCLSDSKISIIAIVNIVLTSSAILIFANSLKYV